MRVPSALVRLILLAVGLVAVACGTSGGSGSPSSAPTATTIASAPTASPTIAPRLTDAPPSPVPSGPPGSPLPAVPHVALTPGTYTTVPRFEVPFAFEVPDVGWENWHLNPDFFDVVRYDGADRNAAPPRWLAFAHPSRIRGAVDTPSEGLTPEAAAALFSDRTDLAATQSTQMPVAGRDGVRLDVQADSSNTVLFGGPGGNLGLEAGQIARVVLLPNDGDLLLVLVIATPETIEQSWTDAQPIIESIEF